jgi:Zn-dependent peptidase ImmA (M78 family)/DNA-binding XRE family transcriptional regulator
MNKFNAEMLILARESRGFSQVELADKLNIKQGTLSKIENGQLDMTDYISKICQALDYPPSFFERNLRTFKTHPHYYRKNITIPKKDLLQAEAIMNILKINLEKLLNSVEVSKVNLPFWNVEEYGSPIKYANYVRQYWRMPKGRVDNLTKLIEDNGIIILELDLGFSKIDGLSIFTDNHQPVILINKNLSGDRQRLTLAHELGHLGMHFAHIIPTDRDIESEAFEFAAELLMPSDEVLPFMTRLNLEKLADLKRYWKISMSAILFKAKKMNLIKENAYRYLQTQFRSNYYHVKEPINTEIPKEKPLLLKEIIDIHLEELQYDIPQLCQLLCLNNNDFQEYYQPHKTSMLKVI